MSDFEQMTRRLSAAPTVVAAAELAMDLCLEKGYELPSVYLERGGRLRCLAQRGYWQVFDGVAPGAGVLGTAYQQGRTQVVHDPGKSEDYIAAIPSVVSEVCVPLVIDGQPAGGLNVESRTPLGDPDVTWIESLAQALSSRIAELGRPLENQAEMLARFAYELASLDDRDRVLRHTLTAAVTVSGMRGACLFLTHIDQVAAAADSGRLGRMLAKLGEEDVRQLVDYVSLATSSYAVGDDRGSGGFEATHVLRDSGVGSLVVLALVAHGRREGILVLVDDQPRPGIQAMIPLLEMLAATSAAMIAAAESRDALQRSERTLAHRARHDSLTGLSNRSGLLETMRHELDDASRRAQAVVLFVDLDGFKDVNDRYGHRGGDQLLAAVADRLRNAARESDIVARIGGDEFVVLCRGVSRMDEATAVGERIMDRLSTPFRLGDVSGKVTACIGIASAEGRGSAEDVIAAADRAMYEAKALGQGRWVLAGPAA